MAFAASTSPFAEEPLVSVIIPALNESEGLAGIIYGLRFNKVPFEVLVVDGGSSDDTASVAGVAGARVIANACRQRAYQLNLGARHARGDLLLFLHADTLLSEGALDLLAATLRNPVVVGGAFARRYASRSRVLRITCLLAQWRNQTIGWHLGDQAMFVRRSIFFRLGGFREVDQFEDLDFSRRLTRHGRVVTLIPGVTSSARRFQDGAARTTLRDLRLTIGYLLKGPPVEKATAEIATHGPPPKQVAQTFS